MLSNSDSGGFHRQAGSKLWGFTPLFPHCQLVGSIGGNNNPTGRPPNQSVRIRCVVGENGKEASREIESVESEEKMDALCVKKNEGEEKMGKSEVAAEGNGEENLCCSFFSCPLCISKEKNKGGIERNSLCGRVERVYQIDIRMQSWPTTHLVNRILFPILSILHVLTSSSILVLSGD
ncbi:hypothetical protein COLO4_23577 [Corchorus olitorius]|uniref:Uncharacterized protein n=1 Tax=Corchorus olitorius TaxID=93759 RepID=A0A1R3IFV9_9ROSI|nr:hypothetical protein COLO4_23577 [Corchorus olitorius]